MMKKQKINAWLLSAHGAWGGLPYVLLQSLRRFFALINRSPFSRRVQWKPASCNGKARQCNGKPASCNGKVNIVQWKVDLHKWKVGLHNRSSHQFMLHPQSPDIWITPYCNFMSKMRCTDWLMRSIVNFPCCIACLRAVTTLATCEGVYGPSTISLPARMDRTAAWLKVHLSLMPAI